MSEVGTLEMRPDRTDARARPIAQAVASDKADGFERLRQLIWPGSIGTVNGAATGTIVASVGAGASMHAASPVVSVRNVNTRRIMNLLSGECEYTLA